MTGLPFGIVLSLALGLFMLLSDKPITEEPVVLAAGGGMLFGCLLAASYRWSARQLGLPSWSSFNADFDSGDEAW